MACHSGVVGSNYDKRGRDGRAKGIDVKSGWCDSDAFRGEVDAGRANRDSCGVDNHGAGVIVDSLEADIHALGCTKDVRFNCGCTRCKIG